MPKAMIMKFPLPSFHFPFIRLVKGSVFYKLNLSFRPTVLSYIVILVFILSKLAMAKEFENQIEEIQSNDPYERDNVLFPHTWVLKAGLPQLEEHVLSLKKYPTIPTGAPDPYKPPY